MNDQDELEASESLTMSAPSETFNAFIQLFGHYGDLGRSNIIVRLGCLNEQIFERIHEFVLSINAYYQLTTEHRG